jgi:hypothetical protein
VAIGSNKSSGAGAGIPAHTEYGYVCVEITAVFAASDGSAAIRSSIQLRPENAGH